jgi:hypothetical protein
VRTGPIYGPSVEKVEQRFTEDWTGLRIKNPGGLDMSKTRATRVMHERKLSWSAGISVKEIIKTHEGQIFAQGRQTVSETFSDEKGFRKLGGNGMGSRLYFLTFGWGIFDAAALGSEKVFGNRQSYVAAVSKRFKICAAWTTAPASTETYRPATFVPQVPDYGVSRRLEVISTKQRASRLTGYELIDSYRAV